ncbi:hypothetical protein [Caballeronia sp. PC1]|uniref:hypothetical protein n=1 Tax=Caballeronia sp. PC1 TaxID=2906765 RepID=UPI001F480384|nr:hypothetical protein [Caballeronia sp. PC1]MCE4543844.1 hypothetical protein [Caballeronia sp. PC1]
MDTSIAYHSSRGKDADNGPLTVYLWTAYPPNVGSPAVTPSVSGLRFLPLALLIAVITQRDDRRSTKPPSEYIHLIWLAGVLWSPESAAQVTVVWWPYYVWRCARSGRNVLHANVRLACWLIATFVAFILIYRIAYGVFPSLTTYLAYVMYPPGPLPINPWGAIWFFGLAGLAGIVSVRRQLRRAPDDHRTQNLVVFALASFGAASYYLGRSHDNNLLNVSVFFLLLLLAVREISDSRLARFVSCAAIAALISYPVLFGWNSWTSLAQSGRLFEFRPRATVSNFTYTSPRGQQANTAGSSLAATASDDADRGMRTIVKQFDEPVTVLDAAINLDASNAGVPWSACHGPENFVYLPSALRRQFLASTADRLTRPGWLLISANYDAASFLSDYDAVYRRDRRLDFGTYYAIRYVPLADRPR